MSAHARQSKAYVKCEGSCYTWDKLTNKKLFPDNLWIKLELWEILLDLQYTSFITTNDSGLDKEEHIKKKWCFSLLLCPPSKKRGYIVLLMSVGWYACWSVGRPDGFRWLS